MLQTYPVRQRPEGKAGTDEIMEFLGAVKNRRVVVNAIANVPLVGMSADGKLVLAFRSAHRRFKADFVCLLCRHFAGRERLSLLKEQDPAFHGLGGGSQY